MVSRLADLKLRHTICVLILQSQCAARLTVLTRNGLIKEMCGALYTMCSSFFDFIYHSIDTCVIESLLKNICRTKP